jgi:CDP-6-deoxy-D-xylo-4-hexulose-3-dehydrase
MVNSGSSANMLALAVLNLKGKEAITPACTFATCIAPMEQLGIKPVFIDVELKTYVPSIESILSAITTDTGCIFIPNLIGSKINWKELRERLPRQDIWLIEDSCDTMTFTKESDISITSFYASHIITAGGCGGMVMFNDHELTKKAFMYRDWGRIGTNSEDFGERFHNSSVDGIPYDFKFLYGVLGYNFKCCEMNAAFGLEQFKKLNLFQSIRRQNVDRYMQRLKHTNYILPCNYDQCDWLAFPLMSDKRTSLLKYLEENNVQVRVCFAGNITRHPAFRHHLKEFPNSDIIMQQGFLLGAHHGLSIKDIDRCCDLLISFEYSVIA